MKSRYLLRKSTSAPDGWVLTDTEHGIACEFLESYFNSTRKLTVLDDAPNASAETLAGIVREMSIWLWRNHRDKCAIRVAIGARLRELRKLRGLSQEELASRIGFKQQNIARIESARYATSIDILGYICDALSCRIELVPNEEKPPG